VKLPEELEKMGLQSENSSDDAIFCFGPFEMNLARWTLIGPLGPVLLAPKQFLVLRALVESGGKPVSTTTLLEKVWGDTSVDTNNVSQVIRRLRETLKSNDCDRNHIITLANVGYRLFMPVTLKPGDDQTGDEVLDINPCNSEDIAESQQRMPPVPVAIISAEDQTHKVSDSNSDSGKSDVIVVPAPMSLRRIISANRKGLYCALLLLLVVIAALAIRYYALRGREEALLVMETSNVTDDRQPKRGPVLFDGQQIWFEEEIDGVWRLVSVSSQGGDVAVLDVPLHRVVLQDIAIDGSALLLSAAEGASRALWSWPLSGGAPQLLPPHQGNVAWSPDQHIVAAEDNGLILAGEASSTRSPITVPFAVILNPRWSPGGEQITFQSVDRKTGRSVLWLGDRHGGDIRPVPGSKDIGEDQVRGIWSRDSRYYFFAGGSVTKHDLWAVPSSERFRKSHSAKALRLTHGPGNWDWPTPGKNAHEIYAIGESMQGKLVSLSSARSVWRPYLGGMPAYEADFSKGGQWMAYIRYPDHTLWRCNLNGSQRVRLTSPDIEAHQPHWSPDGTRIAFMGKKSDEPWRVMIWTSDGKIEEPLAQIEDQGVPTWSPDGRSLLFGDWPYGSRTMALHVLDLSTHRMIPMEGSEHLWTSRWSPDGSYICALRQDSSGLMLKRPGESSWHEIMADQSLDDPRWSPDSKYIYLTERSRGFLVRVHVLTGRVERLADLHDFPATREEWFGVAPDGSALALQAFPAEEIFSLRWVLP
jgi:Tol biopolymer transport system component/DNA-binding winged helix-turn-helix (wHTH) protein